MCGGDQQCPQNESCSKLAVEANYGRPAGTRSG